MITNGCCNKYHISSTLVILTSFLFVSFNGCFYQYFANHELSKIKMIRENLSTNLSGKASSWSEPVRYFDGYDNVHYIFHGAINNNQQVEIYLSKYLFLANAKSNFVNQSKKAYAAYAFYYMKIVDDQIGDQYAYKTQASPGPDLVFRRNHYLIVIRFEEVPKNNEEFKQFLELAKEIAQLIDKHLKGKGQ